MKKVLIVDNYDSFTYNLKHMVEILGHNVIVVKNDDHTLLQLNRSEWSHIILSPGPGNPDNAGLTRQVIEQYHQKIPILGVCLGHQCIAQYFGARIIHADSVMHGKLSLLQHQQTSLFTDVPKQFHVTRYHSLVIAPDSLPGCLTITAQTTNAFGHQDIMAIAHKTLPLFGVQYHPEAIMTQYGKEILSAFLYN